MGIKSTLRSIAPESIVTMAKNRRRNTDSKKALKELNGLEALPTNSQNLIARSSVNLPEIFGEKLTHMTWTTDAPSISGFNIPDLTGGVNMGDRRAIYYLIRHYKPRSVLEIGTHIGASTVHIASAMNRNEVADGVKGDLLSLDIRDVNSEINTPWLQYGTKRSPRQMMEEMGYDTFVSFNVGTSMDYFNVAEKKYDLIFLDGDHSAPTVYKEIPKALNCLTPGGVILMHDYFPNGKSLWPPRAALKGPFYAVRRHQHEGAKLHVIPFGELPWPTKLGGNITSLALLTRS